MDKALTGYARFARRIFEDWENSIERLQDFLEPIVHLFDELGNLLSSTWKGILLDKLCSLLVFPFMVLILCFQLVLMLGPLASAAISAWRIAKLNHGTDSMVAALHLFYSFIIFQGTIFLVLYLTLTIGERAMMRHLRALDQLPSEEWAETAICMYLSDISKKCRKNPLSVSGTDLIKYAVELLDSESQEDYLYGARLLSAFIKKQGEDVRSLLLPSTRKIQKLMESLKINSSLDGAFLQLSSMVDGRCLGVMSNLDDKREIRELAAVIVADLAGHIDLAKYPDSMQYISSLLQEETNPQRPIEPLTQEYKMPQRPIGPLTKTEDLRKRRLVRHQKRIMIKEERRQWTLLRDQNRMMERKERRPKS
jgi:hypothetical protein